MTGSAGGWITRWVNTGPCRAVPPSTSYSSIDATSQQSGSSANGCRFGRRTVLLTSPVTSSVRVEMVARLMGPNCRVKLR